MNTGIKKLRLLKSGLWAFLLLCGALAVQASSSIITFSVDMSVQIANSTFIPGTDTVVVRGTFDGWSGGGFQLAQVGSSSVYTNTYNDTLEANGTPTKYYFKKTSAPTIDETTADYNNRAAVLPSVSGGSLVLPTPFFADAGNQITSDVNFQVDMAQQVNTGAFTPGTSQVEVRGNFNGWNGGAVLTNDPTILRTNQFGLVTTNVYTGVFSVSASTNAAMDFKFVIQPGTVYEGVSGANSDSGGNRFFTHNAAQTLPVVFFSDAPYAPIATNAVTFQVDMSAQILAGNFTNGTTVSVRGNFNGWGTTTLTNDPAASNTNIYSSVITITDGVGVSEYYKFYYYNGGDQWENGDNRTFVQPNTSASVLPIVLFSGVAVNDLIPADTMVTFSVNMNGAVGTDAHAFDPNSDTVWINGEFANWYPWWGAVNPVPGPAQYQMYSAGGGIYTNTVLVSRGKNVSFGYKYGIGNGANGDLGPEDIEAPSGQDHHRSVRSTATGFYTMPQDKFGNQYGEPFFKSSATADGQLKVGAPSSGTIPVSWLGRPGAFLQSAASIAGPWTSHTNTDGANWSSGTATTNGLMSVTNWPATGTAFFRLTKP